MMTLKQVSFLIAIILVTWLCVNTQQQDVPIMCARENCNDSVCRVVQECEGLDCFPVAVCLPCVPEDAEKECNYYGWLYAVLYGSPSNAESLRALKCGVNQCPNGTTCIASRLYDTHGICCYGGKYETAVANRDQKCTPCEPECQRGYSCHQMSSDCRNERYECHPDKKAGICPPVLEESSCPSDVQPESCTHDQECPDTQKCCDAPCGVKSCTEPAMV